MDTWEPAMKSAGPRQKAPEDGIVASLRPRGWLAERWARLLSTLGPSHSRRVARGRTFARGGRLRALWFAPGGAGAEVVGSRTVHASLRVRVLEESEWKRVREVLLADLSVVAALLEGELPESLVDDLASRGLPLVPGLDELESDCTCGDYLMPCEHVAALHNVLAEALDGEPFLLLTLRGRHKDHLLGELRRAWGDTEPWKAVAAAETEPAPEHDALAFFGATDRPSLSFRIEAPVPYLGLKALGPPPGDGELVRGLTPLYDAGAHAAEELVYGEPRPRPDRIPPPVVRPRVRRRQTSATPQNSEQAIVKEDPPMPSKTVDSSLTEVIVDALAAVESAKAAELADQLGKDRLEVRKELLDLEKLGVVYRTGRTRGTRWHLG